MFPVVFTGSPNGQQIQEAWSSASTSWVESMSDPSTAYKHEDVPDGWGDRNWDALIHRLDGKAKGRIGSFLWGDPAFPHVLENSLESFKSRSLSIVAALSVLAPTLACTAYMIENRDREAKILEGILMLTGLSLFASVALCVLVLLVALGNVWPELPNLPYSLMRCKKCDGAPAVRLDAYQPLVVVSNIFIGSASHALRDNNGRQVGSVDLPTLRQAQTSIGAVCFSCAGCERRWFWRCMRPVQHVT